MYMSRNQWDLKTVYAVSAIAQICKCVAFPHLCLLLQFLTIISFAQIVYLLNTNDTKNWKSDNT